MTSDESGGAASGWVCIESTPDRAAAARVEALLRDRGLNVRVAGADGAEIEVQVPAPELERAIAELAELDAIDGDERRD